MKFTVTRTRNKIAVWIGIFALTAIIVSTFVIGIGYKRIYIAYSGEEQQLGFVYSKQQIEEKYEQMKSQMMSSVQSLSFVEQPSLRFEETKRWFQSDETEYVYTQLESGLQVLVNATEIRVQDQPMAIVANETEAAQVLERVKNLYEKEGMQEGTIVETVTSHNIQVSPDQVLTADKAFEQLTLIQKPVETYVVEEGDTLWDISLKKNVPFDDLMVMNPNAGDFLKAGQAVTVSPEKRLLNVRAEGTKVEQIAIPFKTVYKTDNSGKEKEQEGKEGIKEISYAITIENGVEVARSIAAEKLIAAPVDRIRLKAPPVQIASAPSSMKSDETEAGNGTFLWPADGGKVSSGYGYRGKEFHQGIDIAGASTLNIRAGAAGEVVFAGWKGDYGNLVIISHDNGLSTYYAHSKELLVSKGDRVRTGDKIAIMGSTGESTGVHVHFEVRKAGKAVNPNAYLKG